MVSASRLTVLIVEDRPQVARALELLLELEGVATVRAMNGDDALDVIATSPVDLVIQDMNFTAGATSGDEGCDLFRELRRRRPHLPVLLITAWGTVATAVELMKEGAADYIEKPWDDTRLVASVRNLLRLAELEGEQRRSAERQRQARAELADRYDLRGLVYVSPVMHELVSLAVRVARSDVPVLISGANGTGKEHLADLIQANSERSHQPYVKLHAGALPDSLVEAELFGAEAGAFTGADRRRVGRFEAADGGTLLLDEIGTLSAAGQAKLLRVVQTGEFERLGSSRTQRADVRILAATNSDLRSEIAAGRFREDLFFRLNVIELNIPPLADRPEDIQPLADDALNRFAAKHGRLGLRFGDEASRAIVLHHWPGNVRELHNRVQRACLIASRDVIEVADLDLGRTWPPADPEDGDGARRPGNPEGSREKDRIEAVLRDCNGVVSHAAKRLGVSRQALYRSMDRLGVAIERRLERRESDP